MDLLAGFAIAAVSWGVTAAFSHLFRFDLYWLMTAGWGLWAATDSRAHDLRRYERVFPLDPLPLFISIVVLFPVALPWYIRLKNRAMLGLLTEPLRPSRVRWVLAGTVAVGAIVSTLAWGAFTRSDTYQTLDAVVGVLRKTTNESVQVTISTGGRMTRLAGAAIGGLPETSSLSDVTVRFQTVSGSAGVTIRRTEESFGWTVAELRAAGPRDSAGLREERP